MLSITAILIGIIFINLYEKSTTQSYLSDLESQSANISQRLSEFVEDRDFLNVSSYLEVLNEIEVSDVYIISNPEAEHPMDLRMANTEAQNVPKECYNVLEQAFHNKKSNSTTYMKAYDSTMLVVGEPINDSHGEAVGAVLLATYLTSQRAVINNGKHLIIMSVLLALLISFILAIMFARDLSHPISRIRRTALELAKENYDYKTGIYQKNEIGELANTIDILAERLKEIEQQRNNMEQMRMDFFANVSHELRTPITVMRGYTETLQDGIVTDPEKINRYYSRMVTECKSMERLVGDLLILSKMQNPDFSIEKEPVNLVQVFKDVGKSARVIAAEKNIEIEIKRENDSFIMFGDYDRLRQMFMVILDNAIKFSNENSTIYINLKKQDKLVISIRDEGIGIKEEELPFIFEKFYKSKLRQNAKGSGLGLMIARQIALRHNGDIEVKSKEGEGSEFIFYFEEAHPDE